MGTLQYLASGVPYGAIHGAIRALVPLRAEIVVLLGAGQSCATHGLPSVARSLHLRVMALIAR